MKQEHFCLVMTFALFFAVVSLFILLSLCAYCKKPPTEGNMFVLGIAIGLLSAATGLAWFAALLF